MPKRQKAPKLIISEMFFYQVRICTCITLLKEVPIHMPCLTNIPKPMIFFFWYFTKHYSDINHTNLLPNDVKLQKFTLQSTAEHLMQSGWTCCALQQCNAPISRKKYCTKFNNILQHRTIFWTVQFFFAPKLSWGARPGTAALVITPII